VPLGPPALTPMLCPGPLLPEFWGHPGPALAMAPTQVPCVTLCEMRRRYTSLRLPADLLDKLESLALKEERGLSQVILMHPEDGLRVPEAEPVTTTTASASHTPPSCPIRPPLGYPLLPLTAPMAR
jgi:hypothetical protein